MSSNPYADGKIRSHTEAIVRGLVHGAVIVGCWYAPFAWYWRLALFVFLLLIMGIIYPAVQLAFARRKQRRIDEHYETVLELYPDLKASRDETREFREKMAALSKECREKGR
ncbi:MAG: hypothetical protein ABSA13_13115 [Beijerinckiaceae bacterium]|jgi:hypothetical protein